MNQKYLLITLLFAACHAAVPERPKHWIEIKGKTETLFLDTVNSKRVVMLQEGAGNLVSYHIGFRDSSRLLKTGINPDREYFSFRLQHNWKALVHGDSVEAVFYHPLQRLDNSTYEGILMFELDNPPDTLVYTDDRGVWEQQIIVLKNRK